MKLSVRQRASLRLTLGLLQSTGALGAAVFYFEAGPGQLFWIWAMIATSAMITSRTFFYRRFWWSWDEKPRQIESMHKNLLVIAGLSLLTACQSTDQTTHWREAVATLQGHTVPADAQSLTETGPRLEGQALKAEWAFDTEGTPDTYWKWILSKLPRDFISNGSTGASRGFSRRLDNELEHLDIEVDAKPTRKISHVQVHYWVLPD